MKKTLKVTLALLAVLASAGAVFAVNAPVASADDGNPGAAITDEARPLPKGTITAEGDSITGRSVDKSGGAGTENRRPHPHD